MKFISLFSGIGGFDLAFSNAGMICDSMCEIDKNAQAILTRHFPNAKLFDDVKQIGVATHDKGSIDLICGGFPCQDLSVAGKRAGLAGERSGLWFEFARIIDELEPRWVVIENVPGLLSSNKGKDFAVIVRWLAERGYGVAWRVLDAQYFGVPQRRRRVFLVASLGNGRAAEVLFECEGMSGNTPPSREAGKEVAYSLRSNPSHSGDKGDGGVNTTLVPGSMTFTIRSGKDGGGKGYLGQESLPMTLGGQQQYLAKTITTREAASLDSETMNFIVSGTLAASGAGLNRPAGQGNELDFVIPTMRSNGDAHSGFVDADGLVWDKLQETSVAHKTKPQSQLSYTLNKAGQMMVGVRRLTPTECERLQGFPDGWTDGQSDSARYKQLGNAVAVPVVEWIGKRIVAIGV